MVLWHYGLIFFLASLFFAFCEEDALVLGMGFATNSTILPALFEAWGACERRCVGRFMSHNHHLLKKHPNLKP